jgi:hypothetical protein
MARKLVRKTNKYDLLHGYPCKIKRVIYEPVFNVVTNYKKTAKPVQKYNFFEKSRNLSRLF